MPAQSISPVWGFAESIEEQATPPRTAYEDYRESQRLAMERGELPLKGSYCRCTACGTVFFSTSDFDAHRKGKFLQIGENGRGRYCELSSTSSHKEN